MSRSADGQYEMVLENRQVLTIFFAVVVLCGVFFGLGYTVGKNTVGYTPTQEAGSAADGKRSALLPVSAENGAAADSTPAPASEPPAAAPAGSKPAPVVEAPASTPQPAAAAAPAEGAITLQIAALSKKDDADSLLSVLQRKGYQAFSTSNSADRLYRIQVGPFRSAKEAEEAKNRLHDDGFRPILRK